MAADAAEEARTFLRDALVSLPPLYAIDDLLSTGVCVRCVLRLFGVHGHAYSCPSLTDSVLRSFIQEHSSCCAVTAENRTVSDGSAEELENKGSYCSICLGVLQFAYRRDWEMRACEEKGSVDEFAGVIAEAVKREGYQIDGFTLEISIPALTTVNERAIWLYMKRKYDSEGWFKEKFQSDHISVKDALRSSITSLLENYLDTKSGGNSFRIRLTYNHLEVSTNLQCLLAKDHSSKRRKNVAEDCRGTVGVNGKENRDFNEHIHNESDAFISRVLNGLHENDFCQQFVLPPEKVYKPCQLAITCCRTPIYIGGRYLKFSRKVSQSRWIIDDERMGEASVEEIVGGKTLLICKGDTYKFHAAGREDIDVRMLGSGRPFLVEVSNARHLPSLVDIQQVEDTINNSDIKYVGVRNLMVVAGDAWALMREGEAEKQKQYAALVWIPRPLSEEDLQKISSIKNMDILQRTPIRVLHRRSPLERKRIIHWMRVEKITGRSQYFLLHLCTQAGTYIKEFVHGDLGRTHPSIGSILGCRAEILQLDVTDVKMDSFD